eukprot:CAMPEP_0174366446 /NCGR_PEP_ID=MMETSP0811_2-20130205/81213_1 /TAXON_ID=73025 ORGANISM="Eutreptiella gymnastica-like, Strain CCMP1594" /NCGR_SAMPLE_ID=MMETSP0811_2 /ASSEMBLY_ACC=CAM_ASM_000667 /LENGTH=165 /DNA_ID=CAMNT_0015508011 /DNA_START=212 /DNA_END=709 /DNA_ORIENTATION=+
MFNILIQFSNGSCPMGPPLKCCTRDAAAAAAMLLGDQSSSLVWIKVKSLLFGRPSCATDVEPYQSSRQATTTTTSPPNIRLAARHTPPSNRGPGHPARQDCAALETRGLRPNEKLTDPRGWVSGAEMWLVLRWAFGFVAMVQKRSRDPGTFETSQQKPRGRLWRT